MLHQKTKCVMILSAKSSGSTALQNLLASYPHISHVSKTRHNENETLFWVKAASVLSLPQVDMPDSEVPIPPKKARSDLIELLTSNLGASYVPPTDDRDLVFGGWRQLCQRFAPVFVEKSPHHLHQWSALELVVECIEKLPDVEFLLVGLVRNPMDVIYSTWRRWRGIPARTQYEWCTSYDNLLKLEPLVGERLVVIRYEDMVNDNACLKEVYRFTGVTDGDSDYLHSRSLGKWRRDKLYGFQLAHDVAMLAERYGYSRSDMANDSYPVWPLYLWASRCLYRMVKPAQPALRAVKRRLRGGR